MATLENPDAAVQTDDPAGSDLRLTLNIPEVAPMHFRRNLLEKAVCELRFPTLYGLERGKPPISLANALRKEFPEHGVMDDVNVSAGSVAKDFGHIFRDKKRRTSIIFRAAAITIETSAYQSFDEFLARILFAVKSAREAIDTDFFTRIGLRYINTIPYDRNKIGEWINPVLVSPLSAGHFGDPVEYNGRIATIQNQTGFLLQHGLRRRPESSKSHYVLDFDVWREDITIDEVQTAVEELHSIEFRLFHWSLGPAAFAHMGPADPMN